MKASRFLQAIPLAILLLASPSRAEQHTIVGPITGPRTMAEVMGTINDALIAIQSCNSGISAPANGIGGLPTTYQCWADTSAAPAIALKKYDGASWVTVGVLDAAAHTWTPYRNGAPIAVVATSSSAADLTTGTLPAARLPMPSASTLGGIFSKVPVTSQWLRSLGADGALTASQPAFSDLSGSLASTQMPALTGDVSTSAGATVTTIGAHKVVNSMLRQSAALSLLGRSANLTGDVADISAAAASSCAFRESGNTVGCGELATAAYAANSVTNAKLSQMANGSTKCRTTALTGDPEDCTASQMRSLLSLVPGVDVQAFDSDLSAIAALTTTSYGRSLLTLASEAAFKAAVNLEGGVDFRAMLSANLTLYVRTDGSDGNTGLANTAGGAFLTVQKAVDFASALDLSIYNITIQIADGTYTSATGVILKSYVGAGPITIQGNTTTPDNVILNITSDNAITANSVLGKYALDGFKVQASANGILASNNSLLDIRKVNYGACANHIVVTGKATVLLYSSYTVSGNAASHMLTVNGGTIGANNALTATFTGTPAFTTTLNALNASTISVANVTWSGAATGQRYNCADLSLMLTGGATIPGSTAGAGTTPGTSPYGRFN